MKSECTICDMCHSLATSKCRTCGLDICDSHSYYISYQSDGCQYCGAGSGLDSRNTGAFRYSLIICENCHNKFHKKLRKFDNIQLKKLFKFVVGEKE